MMNAPQYLIINLRRFGDIMTSAHLVSVLKEREPECEVSFLVYEESARAAHILADVKNVFAIDRKRIGTLKENRLFSDAFALNALSEILSEVKKVNWKSIINTSNDVVSCHLLSYLTFDHPEVFKGLRFNKNFNAESSSIWATAFNDVITSFKHTPIHFVDTFLGMSDAFQENIPVAKMKTNAEYDQTAALNFKKIREDLSGAGSDVKIVAIQLKASTVEKDIPFNSLIELINKLLDDPRFYPVLLVAPFADERNYANEVNQLFNNGLISIEADFLAMNSVLQNVDLLVTPDTVLKHQAELLGVPLVEISLGPSPFLRQGPVRPGNLILTPALSYRTWFEKTDIAHDVIVSGQDIFEAVQIRLGFSNGQCELSRHLSLYVSRRGRTGTSYQVLAGEINVLHELNRLMAKEYLFDLMGIKRALITPALVENFNERQVLEWIAHQKQTITEVTQELLGTLRALLQVEKKTGEAKDFVTSLERLLKFCDKEELSGMAVLLFRARLEQMESKTPQENMKAAEQKLYALKDDMATLVVTIKNFEDMFRNLRKAGRPTQTSTEGNYGTTEQ